MAINIFFKIFIMCIPILSHKLYWGLILEIEPGSFGGILCLVQCLTLTEKNGKFTLLINGCVICLVVYNLGAVHKIVVTNPYWEKYNY